MKVDGNSFGIEEWRSFARPFFDVIPTGRPEAFGAHAASEKLGRLVVSEVRFDAAIFDRDPGRVRDVSSEFLLLETYDSGSNRGRSGDIVTGLDAGSVHVFDMARPWRTQSTAVTCRSVVIPYSVIGYDPSRRPVYVRLPADSPRNSMVLAAMGALFDAGARLGTDDADALAESFCGLVQRLIFDQQDRDATECQPDGQVSFLRRYIDEHLAEPDLGPERLCAALGVSRATLYRMLPSEGGVRGYIAARRLDRCFDELLHGPSKRGRVRRVAEGWGFWDPKSFNRAFRARFDVAPSDCLDRSLRAERPTVDDGHPINDWMRRL